MSLLALSLSVGMVFVSCGGDEDEPSANATSLSNSVLSGKVESFDGSVSQVKALAYTSDAEDTYINVGEGAISSTGSFSINLVAPGNAGLCKIGMDSSFVGTISDTTALISKESLVFAAYSGTSVNGALIKSNFTSTDLTENQGAAYSIFVYSDKDVKVSGKSSISENISGYQLNYTENYNFTLKKGWNELVYKVSKVSYTTTTVTEELSLTNTISSDLKWRLMSDALKSAMVDDSAKAHFLKTPLIFKSK